MGNQLHRKRKLHQPTPGLPTDDSLLVCIIETGYGLLDELQRCGVLDRRQVELIDGERTRIDAVRRLLDEIKRKSLDQQELFLSALDKTKQSHVSDYILNNGHRPSNRDSDNWPIYGYSRWGRIEQQWVQLKDSIDSRHSGLLDELLSVHCISRQHRNFLARQMQHTMISNEMLLMVIRGRSFKDYYKFIDCLTKTKQHQAVALLEPERYTNEKPLSRRQRDTLTANCSALAQLIDMKRCGLASRLLSADVITRRQKECVESALEPSESNRRLLDIVKRGSRRDFNKFVDCLRETGQHQIADLLSGDGVVAEMAVQTSLSQADESFITEQFLILFSRTAPDENASRQFRVFGEFSEALQDCQLVAMKLKEGLKLFILCKSLSGLLLLSEIYSAKRLELVVFRIISVLLDNRTPKNHVTVHNLVWRLSNYNNCVQHLSNITGLPVYARIHRLFQHTLPDATASGTNCYLPLLINKFPHELVELSLIKATVSLLIVAMRMTSRADVHAMATLLSVCRYWWDTLTYRHRNKSLLKQYVRQASVCAGFRFNPKPIAVLHFHKSRRIQGMAEFNGKLYVVASGSNTIEVLMIVGTSYHDNCGEKIEVAELMEPGDVVACRATSCLFVSDSATRCIWRVSLSDEQLNVRKVSDFIKTGYVPFTLSVRSGRLLVTELHGTAVHVYSCEGSQPITLADKESVLYTLPEYMLAYHAVPISGGTTLVCHRNRTIGDTETEHRPGVCEVSADGMVLRRNKNAEELHDPEYVTAGDSGKHILVCDRLNRRLVRLNVELGLEQVVLTEGELRGQPWRLCYCEERRVLYVCYYDLSVADVYRV